MFAYLGPKLNTTPWIRTSGKSLALSHLPREIQPRLEYPIVLHKLPYVSADTLRACGFH